MQPNATTFTNLKPAFEHVKPRRKAICNAATFLLNVVRGRGGGRQRAEG